MLEWKDVDAFKGHYQVSNEGQVRSIKFNKIKLLKPSSNGHYMFVYLYKNNIKKAYYVHRLVAEAFLPYSPSPHVNHKDGDKLNNASSNLEWCTIQENNQHAFSTGLKTIWNKGLYGSKTSRSKTVEQLALTGEVIGKYGSARDAGRQLGIRGSGISTVCRGSKKTYKGYIWRYKSD